MGDLAYEALLSLAELLPESPTPAELRAYLYVSMVITNASSGTSARPWVPQKSLARQVFTTRAHGAALPGSTLHGSSAQGLTTARTNPRCDRWRVGCLGSSVTGGGAQAGFTPIPFPPSTFLTPSDALSFCSSAERGDGAAYDVSSRLAQLLPESPSAGQLKAYMFVCMVISKIPSGTPPPQSPIAHTLPHCPPRFPQTKM